MDETETEVVVTAGQRLREAREAKGLSIEDIAAQTRIPTRHLSSIEIGDWSKLPAATYSVGFAKNYASAVGLDRNEIGDQLRSEMGVVGPTYAHPEVYEAADPARAMPKGLVFGALALLVLVVLALTWLSNRSLEPDEVVAEADNVAAPVENVSAPAVQPAQAAGPVVLTATDAVWIEIKDGALILKQGQLAPGQSYEVPANAAAPQLTTGKPEALRITVGSQPAPAVGEPGRTVSGVSLKAEELMRTATTPPAAGTQSQVSPAVPQPAQRVAPRRTAASPPVETPDSDTSTSSEPAAEVAAETTTQP
jgi:cytoskeletal protein RodZ